jgi:hypothetical protein
MYYAKKICVLMRQLQANHDRLQNTQYKAFLQMLHDKAQSPSPTYERNYGARTNSMGFGYKQATEMFPGKWYVEVDPPPPIPSNTHESSVDARRNLFQSQPLPDRTVPVPCPPPQTQAHMPLPPSMST